VLAWAGTKVLPQVLFHAEYGFRESLAMVFGGVLLESSYRFWFLTNRLGKWDLGVGLKIWGLYSRFWVMKSDLDSGMELKMGWNGMELESENISACSLA
jgi:hypothetical protein